MTTQTPVKQAIIDDLYQVRGKAEIVGGEVVIMPPTGFDPSRAGGDIYSSLREYERRAKSGYALLDNAAFSVKRMPVDDLFS